MNPTRCSVVLFSVFTTVLTLIFSSPAAANRVNLDDLGNQLGQGIKKENLKSVTIADFLATDGSLSDLGWYLANRLSDSWLQHSPKFRVVDRSELATKILADDLRNAASLRRLGSIWGVEAIVTGSVDALPDHYQVTASVRRVADGAIIVTASEAIPRSRILDLLTPQGLDIGGVTPLRAGINGTGVPVCLKCPIPEYSDKARKAGIRSTAVLTVVISTDGRAARIAIVKDPGHGLTDQAIETVSDWEFKAALNQEGKPAVTIVPIEVTFRPSPH
jgi:TonB family protein